MPDEIMKSFLEQIIGCLDSASDALRLLLQYYHVTTAEKEFENALINMDSEMNLKGDHIKCQEKTESSSLAESHI